MLNKLDQATEEKIAALIVTAAWMVIAHFSSNPDTFWAAGIFFWLAAISFRLAR